ncbi:Hypothetical predicted protein [Cloeon dipterum]|uniref:Uncharacterized protein n=1 Tax=Cloeon dipterum TaxID=197152 RepID=A0A8S1CBD2_9INSE|nr:Hypothetical predicted protein [Cloeon dipterum]
MQPLATATLAVALLLLQRLGVDSRVDGYRNKAQPLPPGYKHSAFRLIVPEAGLAPLTWHAALKNTAFQSLRRKIISFADSSRAEQILWEQLAAAPIYPAHLKQPEREDADLSILAKGVLVREGGQLLFAPDDILLYPSATPRKVSAIWSVIRVRHSGPGLKAPKIEYYFTVTPASHLTMLHYLQKQVKGYQKNPYDGPFFDYRPGHFYHPLFINSYRQSVQSFIGKHPEEELINSAQEARNEPVIFKQEPIYIIPSPRLIPQGQEKSDGTGSSTGKKESKTFRIIVQKQRVIEENKNEAETVEEEEEEEEDMETTTKISSKYRDTSKESQ